MFTLKAPAKINWFLHILFLRDDGFHEIQSVMQKITLFDKLSFKYGKDILIVTNSNIALHDNLVYKAAKHMQQTYCLTEGAEIHLTKNIPVGAGLGGGSSDAATTLTGLNRLWSLELSHKELHPIAQSLGSDVPFFLYNSLAYVHGRGEKIIPCTAKKTHHLILVKPPFSVSTAWAYKNRILSIIKRDDNTHSLCESIVKGDIDGLDLLNDLEEAVINHYPLIGKIKEELYNQGAVTALMSGSGSCVFGVFNSSAAARRAAETFQDFWTAVVETLI
jgi:4-diphosphocytidyl-2-C-methyl-D-erythritol kinase